MLSNSVVDPPPVPIIGDPKVQADSAGRSVQVSCTGWLKPFAGETFTITLAICPTFTVTGDALMVKLVDVVGNGDMISAKGAETLALAIVSPV